MKSIRSVVAGLVMAAGVTATLPLSAGTAVAADKTTCFAPNGQYCLAFNIGKGSIYKSARLNGTCQTGPFHQGRRTHYPYTFVDINQSATVVFYVQDGNCGSGEGLNSFTIYPARSNAGTKWGTDGRWAFISGR